MQDTDSIFLLGKSGNLERVPHREYQSEDLLQDIVDRHPELIVGEQINPVSLSGSDPANMSKIFEKSSFFA